MWEDGDWCLVKSPLIPEYVWVKFLGAIVQVYYGKNVSAHPNSAEPGASEGRYRHWEGTRQATASSLR